MRGNGKKMMTPGQKAARWIETFCIYPNGFNKGQFVVLTTEQRETVLRVFDSDDAPEVRGPLAAYLALFHVAGPRDLAVEQRHAMSARDRVLDLFGSGEAGAAQNENVERRRGAYDGLFRSLGWRRGELRFSRYAREGRQAQRTADRRRGLDEVPTSRHGRLLRG